MDSFAAPSPLLQGATSMVFAIHIAAGTVALVSGTAAAVAAKGGGLHRRAGGVFVAAMAIMAVFAAILAIVMPGQVVNLVIAIFTLYLVATGWLAGRRRDGDSGLAEGGLFLVGAGLCAPFAVLSFQLATGEAPFIHSAVAFEGPVLVAIFVFTAVTAIATIGDARVLLSGGVGGSGRIARHLWRLCVGLALSAGSAFTNGLPRLLPGPMHVSPAFFLPQFLPVGLLVFWLIRVRLPGWPRRAAAWR